MVEIRRGLERASGFVLLAVLLIPLGSTGQELPLVRTVDLQPLAAQALRLIETMDYLGSPLDPADQALLRQAAEARNPAEDIVSIQKVLDNYTLIDVRIDPESRVKVDQGLAPAELVEQGWRTFLVKVRNEANVTAELRVESPNAGPVYTRSTGNPSPDQILKPADQMNRWLDLFLYKLRPMRPRLSGLELEYTILQVYSRDRGKREARISFNVGQGTQDIGLRNDLNLVFNSRPSIDVTLRIFDEKGEPTTASFIFRDPQGHVYPSQAKRLAPDFPFHPQVYRSDGESLKLPPGTYSVEYTRGPEYHLKRDTVEIAAGRPQALTFRLDRWIRPSDWGWYSGDHHIHAAGCAHYEDPTQGVFPQDMIRHIKGEALNVGNVLTWGPCFYFQKQFFEAKVSSLSTRENLMRYDVEVSGFPSSHSGHLTLLNLNQQEYPGTRRIEDWPTWDLPILKWARSQGAVVGFAHSGWGLEVETEKLPHYEMPPFDGIGANEYIVDVTHDMVDFISTVDTPAHWELNIWYHTLNTGFRTRISGETDFPLHLRRARRPGAGLRKAGRSAQLRWLGGRLAQGTLLRLRRKKPSDGFPPEWSLRGYRGERGQVGRAGQSPSDGARGGFISGATERSHRSASQPAPRPEALLGHRTNPHRPDTAGAGRAGGERVHGGEEEYRCRRFHSGCVL